MDREVVEGRGTRLSRVHTSMCPCASCRLLANTSHSTDRMSPINKLHVLRSMLPGSQVEPVDVSVVP